MFSFWCLALVGGLLRSVHAACPVKSNYPKVTPGWGSYLPTDCDDTLDIYIFRNIRYGKAPDDSPGGTRRFARSQRPDDIPNPKDHIVPPPTGPTACLAVLPPKQDGAQEPHAPDYGGPIHSPGNASNTTEDCLFLDIYVPISAIPQDTETTAATPLPVVVWIYGGAYLFGAKDTGLSNNIPFYDGRGLIQAAQNLGSNLIFVAGNYRLAHLGWLAGPIVNGITDPDQAVTNAGFTDQRLLLEFVQFNIGLFGGDPGQVTAFGESAGASSILHHLVAQNDDRSGPRDPLFQRAIMQSPAYQWIWDQTPSGLSQVIFDNFTANVPACSTLEGADALACLQDNTKATLDDIQTAMNAYRDIAYTTGIFNLGPVVDGKTFPALPVQLLESDNFQFHPNVKAIIASHVADEAARFIPSYANSAAGFQQLLDYFLPGTGKARPSKRTASPSDSMFVCNVRFTYDAATSTTSPEVKPPIWLMDYAFFAKAVFGEYDFAFHGTDLIPTFWNDNTQTSAVGDFICTAAGYVNGSIKYRLCLDALDDFYFGPVEKMRVIYQEYMANFMIMGNRNPPSSDSNLINWPNLTGDGDNVLKIADSLFGNFASVESPDSLIAQDTCQFWKKMADAATRGVAPDESICIPKPTTVPVAGHDDGSEEVVREVEDKRLSEEEPLVWDEL